MNTAASNDRSPITDHCPQITDSPVATILLGVNFLSDRSNQRNGAGRAADYSPWGSGDAGVHAGGNAGVGKERSAGHPGGTGSADSSGKYLPSLLAAGSEASAPTGWVAPFHGVAARHSDRLGRIPGLQFERVASGDGRRRKVSFSLGWLFPFSYTRKRNGGA